jgi:hypothetical protein
VLDHPASKLFYVREQSAAGTVIGKLIAVDSDNDDKVFFEVSGNDFFSVF